MQGHRWTVRQLAIASFAALSLAAGPAAAQTKIGFNVPLTGFAAADGASALNGAKLAVAQANASGADISTAEFLVEQIRELTAMLPVADPDETTWTALGLNGEATVTVYDDVDDFDDFDSAALGAPHTDTWNLFYQSNSEATGSQTMWTNVGTDFVFNSTGKLTSPTTGEVTIPNMSINGNSMGSITFDFGTNGLTQYASSQGDVDVTLTDQDGYASGSLISVGVGVSVGKEIPAITVRVAI